MEGYWNKYGLLNAYKNEDVAENCPLFSYEYILIKEMKGDPIKPEREALRTFIENSKVRKGLYNQSPEPLKGVKEDYMSHDQLSTFCAFSYRYGYDWHKDIWKEIKRQWLRYNNVDPTETFWQKLTNKRFLHLRDILYIGILAGNPICKLFAPVLLWLLESSSKDLWKVRPALEHRIIYFFKNFKFFPEEELRKMPNTDGKLLTFVRCRSALDIPIMVKAYKSCSEILNQSEVFKGWDGTFGIYWDGRPDHPINLALNDFSLN